MSKPRVPLYERLPEIYRIKDAEQSPPYPLKNYLAAVEEAFGAIHENIESLYHDLFIETCDDWVIPYIGDLLGTSHLKGETWTLRADVADTIALRRRKGTLGAIERLTYDLTQWGVHAVELRENLVWAQHLNHQRPDAGGFPPYRDDQPLASYPIVPRGGTMPLRDPSLLALLNTPFSPYAHIPDVNRAEWGQLRYNLPNLAIYLWRLEAYTLPGTKPVYAGTSTFPDPEDETLPPADLIGVRFYLHALERPVRLFNTYRFDPDRQPPVISSVDEVPSPIHPERLTSESPAGQPDKYVLVETYDPDHPEFNPIEVGDVGLQFYVPEDDFPEGTAWTFRGADLSDWRCTLQSPLKKYEIAIDPYLGRVMIPVEDEDQRAALENYLRVTYTYGAVGPVGAHPISRESRTASVIVNGHDPSAATLSEALESIEDKNEPWVVEIQDSLTHELDLNGLDGTIDEDGGVNLRLKRSLIIRAAADQRPTIKLAHPLRFRPTYVASTLADATAREEEQKTFDAWMNQLTVRLEGVYITRGSAFAPASDPLIARAAVNALELVNCTLDPVGYQQADGVRAPILTSLKLANGYGFTDTGDDNSEYNRFNQTPQIIVQRTQVGPLRIDDGYTLFLTDSIVDAGRGVSVALSEDERDYAVTAAVNPLSEWGPATRVNGVTIFGRMRVERISGRGAVFVHALEALDNQHGCVKFSYFSGEGNRLPQWHACVFQPDAALYFNGELFEQPAYGQLAHASDDRIREQGPADDAMGAFGFLLEAHKWRNLQIRYREFMPVGVRPLLIPVT